MQRNDYQRNRKAIRKLKERKADIKHTRVDYSAIAEHTYRDTHTDTHTIVYRANIKVCMISKAQMKSVRKGLD